MAALPIKTKTCISKGRMSKSGERIIVTTCKVEGSEAVLIFKDGILHGVTGNATLADVDRFTAMAGKTAASMGITIEELAM